MRLIDQLEQRRSQQQKQGQPAKGMGRVYFQALKSDIEAAIALQWPYKEIYTLLHEQGRMPISYRLFCHYIDLFITAKNDNSIHESTVHSAIKKPIPTKQTASPLINREPIRTATVTAEFEPKRLNYNSEITEEDKKRLL